MSIRQDERYRDTRNQNTHLSYCDIARYNGVESGTLLHAWLELYGVFMQHCKNKHDTSDWTKYKLHISSKLACNPNIEPNRTLFIIDPL